MKNLHPDITQSVRLQVWNCSIPPLAAGAKITREQASIIAQGLMNAQIFAHLGSAADFTDDETLYRLLAGEELTVVLNRQVRGLDEV